MPEPVGFREAVENVLAAHQTILNLKPPKKVSGFGGGKGRPSPVKPRLLGLEDVSHEDSERLRKNYGLIFSALSKDTKSQVSRHPLLDRYLSYAQDDERRSEMMRHAEYGLLRAIQKHDPTKGELSTYSVAWIRRATNNYLNGEVTRFRAPSLDRETVEGGRTELRDFTSEAQEEGISEPIVVERLNAIFKALEKDERTFRIYVLGMGLGHRPTDIARHEGMTRQNVSRIMAEAHDRLPPEMRFDLPKKKED